MNLTKRFFAVEKQHFDRLSDQAKNLIAIFFLFNLIWPIFTIFTSAFIWRQSQDISTVAIFNLAIYLAMPFGFYSNGHLLQKFLPSRLFFVGLLGQILATGAVIFSPVINYPSVFFYGALFGLASGFFWANRSLLVLRITLSKNRIYFTSLDTTISMLLGIIIPIVIGTFIVFGQTANLYTPVQAYYFLCFFMLFIAFFIFQRSKHIKTKLPQLDHIFLKNPTKQWGKMRLFIFTGGLIGGLIGFIPTLMVLTFVGKEDAVGTIQSLSAVAAAAVVYSLGKKITREQRLWIIGGNVIFSILAAVSFALLFSQSGVFAFFVFNALAIPLSTIGISTLYFDMIEKEGDTKENHYAHIFDAEICINSARVTAILAFLLFIHLSSEATALRFTLLIFTVFQILLFFVARSIEKGNKSKMTTELPQPTIV